MGQALSPVLLVLLLAFQTPSPNAADQLGQARNLGKAFFENPTTQTQAVDQFKKALDMQPNSARERVNYGISLLHAGKTREASSSSSKRRSRTRQSRTPGSTSPLPTKRLTRFDKAIIRFQGMVKLVPG